MNIIDTYEEINTLFKQMNGTFNITMWEHYIDKIVPGLKEMVLEDHYDFEKQVLPVLKNAMSLPHKLDQLHDSFIDATKNLKENMKRKLQVDLEVDIILYVGLCNGAGWATTINQRHVVLLGIEKIIELDWCNQEDMTGLIYHELGHIWHDTIGTLEISANNNKDKYIWQLYQEGIAMYIEHLLSDNMNYFYRKDKNGWLDWCHLHKHELFKEYLRRIDHNESCQDFFGDWCAYQGHSDVGYYLGCELCKELLKKYNLVQMANLNINEIYLALKSMVNDEKETII